MKSIRNVIGPQLRRLRSDRGLTQDALATRLQRAGWDVSRASVGKIEAQLRWVADCELFMLAEALEVALPDFFPSSKEVRHFVASPGFKRN